MLRFPKSRCALTGLCSGHPPSKPSILKQCIFCSALVRVREVEGTFEVHAQVPVVSSTMQPSCAAHERRTERTRISPPGGFRARFKEATAVAADVNDGLVVPFCKKAAGILLCVELMCLHSYALKKKKRKKLMRALIATSWCCQTSSSRYLSGSREPNQIRL